MRGHAALAFSAIFATASCPAIAEANETSMSFTALSHAIDRLGTTARVLYVAAHPDDENTRLLAYLSNHRHLTVAYLSMTRGGGGQNLIGSEQDELLDVIRTQELLAARALDGATQRFTRMRDFGFSKTAEETLAIWGKDRALADVVSVIRTFQPDLIITRFDERPPNHGHHTASAILAREAFTAAADPARFPELGGPWKSDRLLHNVSSWRPENAERGPIKLDVGAFDARLGLSYGEVAARSRSMHKSQGFGVPSERGPLIEKFEWVAGTRTAKDPFEAMELGWNRFGAKGQAFGQAIAEAKASLDPEAPERAIPALLRAHRLLDELPDQVRVRDARTRVESAIGAAAGLFLRATADRPGAAPSSEVPVELEAVMRRPAGLRLERVRFPGGAPVEVKAALGINEKKEITQDVAIAADAPISVIDHGIDPEPPAPLRVLVDLTAGGRPITFEVPVVYVWTDRVHGERERRFSIMPPATVTPTRKAVMLANGKPGRVLLRVRASQADVKGTVRLPLPAGWLAKPAAHEISLARAGEELTVSFDVSAPAKAARIDSSPIFESGGRAWSHRVDVIDHAHIPMQVVLRPAVLALVPLRIATSRKLIGYVMGSGDSIAEDLAHVGMRVESVDDETLRSGDLDRFSAIVVGIRAYNTRETLKSAHARLMSWVERGGAVIVQYNTNSNWDPLTMSVGPYPLAIGRERTTDESAAMTPLDPKHALLAAPNALAAADFDGWVQERGLYFADKYDAKYQPIFSMQDPGEKSQQGALLFAKHGRGRYVYTGLAFFRQLPAGVPGAYRLFANLIGR